MHEGPKDNEILRINIIQTQLAGLLFPDSSAEDAMLQWTSKGYFGQFQRVIEQDEDMHRRVQEGDPQVVREIYTILTKNETV